ncbi:MAG: acylneuraminate cytidylyltransferase family protein [Actinomyces urogenitalis]|uniref:acylneuraminate cytidylyltransferase family protein n=1 Tax=Actinomyces urogenitalis TaxID=103621 RepID=UPI002A8219B9|nr:acylneuraminate cytidylyltransferase family protein [Actinomyces urogenitalis]MDY3677858.1 acylneuraminate cytidylyltransferase family protein [Actinomyces urogenitalis]
MSMLAVIPVRGGSKGIPRKNLRDVGGKPLVVWTIEQALTSTSDLRVVVSTEDTEIAQVARAAGAEVISRPAELAQDTTATEPVVVHAMDVLAEQGYEPDYVMLLQATSPVRRPGTIDRALTQIVQTGVDSLVGVVPQTPFLWWTARDSHGPTADFDVNHRPRRQELTVDQMRYRETGSLYVTRPWVYREHQNRIGGKIGLFVMDEVEGVDIDSPLDLALAGKTLTQMQQENVA